MSDQCKFCEGHGTIWTNWNGNRPVTCGHCHGTGKRSPLPNEADSATNGESQKGTNLD